MEPLGMRLPVVNRVMLVIFILGIVGIALVVPSFRGMSPSGNQSWGLSPGLSLGLPHNNSSARAGPAGRMAVNITPAPKQSITPAMTPAPVASPPVLPRSNLSSSRRNVTPFVAALTAMNPAPVSMPADLRAVDTHYEFRDNNRKQVVSVSVSHFAAATRYSYHFKDITVPDIITVNAKPGHRFFFIGVTWDLTGIVGEGKRTTFMTPAVTSYKLINRETTYLPVDPDTITDILQDSLIDFGSLAREESIDKDNPAYGVLIYEVPLGVTARESYIEFCPENSAGTTEPHSPAWDCEKQAVRWRIVP